MESRAASVAAASVAIHSTTGSLLSSSSSLALRAPFHKSKSDASARPSDSSSSSSSLCVQRRTSFKYARKVQHVETQQPFYIHEKRHGLFSNERNIAKSRRGLPMITPLYTKHMNLWETDTDASTNRFFRSYVFGQRELHQLLGRPHGFESDEAGGKQGDSAYELQTDQRFKGMQTPMFANLHYEPEWNYTLYAHQAHTHHSSCAAHSKDAAALVEVRPPSQEELLGRELAVSKARDMKNVTDCKAWFDRLQYLIQLHYDAVGDIGPFRSRHTQHVHEFFVAFHDAISSFDFQDVYLFQQFEAVRPKELEDIFGIFMEMEANYVHLDYCPRCSLPYATTRFCGEGDQNTPFRRHRGRWAPHQQWGKEWFDVVTRRAEALWYRATEDPYFGLPRHTQRQVEALLRVYCQTRQRAKALDFIHAIRGSVEFLTGLVQVTPAMQEQLDGLLDTTEHQHLLTNGFTLHSRTSLYTGEVQKVPHSPLQMLLDMKLNVFRRQQREEGVVRVPPPSWRIQTSAIVPYQLDPQTKQVTNWRDVKAGIEKAFLDPGLPREAYTTEEWRWLRHWKHVVAARGPLRAALEAERQADLAAAAKANKTALVFPTAHWYQVFDTSSAALAPFAGIIAKASSGSGLQSGTLLVWLHLAFPTPTAVVYEQSSGQERRMYQFDVTPEACAPFGGYEHGEVLRIRRPARKSAAAASPSLSPSSEDIVEVVVVGVDKTGDAASWSLCAMFLDKQLHTERGVVELGKNSDEVLHTILGTVPDRQNLSSKGGSRKVGQQTPSGSASSWNEEEAAATKAAMQQLLEHKLGRQYRTVLVEPLVALRTVREEFLGQVVGVRRGCLYAQWRLLKGGSSLLDRSVALCLGTPETMKKLYVAAYPQPKTTNAEGSSGKVKGAVRLQEPPSWWVPFRNDHADERLKEAVEAPFQREQWASLIPGKYTPKKKRFGYSQHSTQDDFLTKEYRDRLLSRQFFHQPQMFEVIPERHEKSVRFGGKWEYQKVCGLPTVDRNELEKGWGEVDVPISDDEMRVMEQAIRDISGDRPGNYIKSPTETQSLQLNESWWTSLGTGWEEHNRFERAFHHRLEQGLVDSSRLPFQGAIPPFGTTYGIGERIREIIRDYSKGFGLGPTGHTPSHDQVQYGGGMDYHNLEREAQRVRNLGLGNALVRLFDEKLSRGPHATDLHGWAMEQVGQKGVHPRKLLLSLHEWREKGQQPSLLLQQVLSTYLQEELQVFNDGLPQGVPKLVVRPPPPTSQEAITLLQRGGEGGNEGTRDASAVGGQIWADVDRRAYAYEYVANHKQQLQDATGVGFIVDLVLRASSEACFRGGGPDERSRGAFLDAMQSAFHMSLARVANKGIPAEVSNDVLASSAGTSGLRRNNAAVAVPLIRGSELAKVLKSFRVSAENVEVALRGLAQCKEHQRIDGRLGSAVGGPVLPTDASTSAASSTDTSDIVVPVSLVMTWGGPGTVTSAGTFGSSSSTTRTPWGSAAAAAGGAGSSGDSKGKMVIQVMEELSVLDDGFMADLQFRITKNLENPILRQEFMQTFLPVYRSPKETARYYEEYATGKFVPNIKAAQDAFVRFLSAYATKGEAVRAAAAVDYFEAEAELPRVLQGGVLLRSPKGIHIPNSPTVYASPPRIRLLPPGMGPFQFENTILETMETLRVFKAYGIQSGPDAVEAPRFVRCNVSSSNYFTDRPNDTVQLLYTTAARGGAAAAGKGPQSPVVDPKSELGELLKQLQQSPDYKAIHAHPLLQPLTTNPAALAAAFNRYFTRVLPMLSVYYSLIQRYNSIAADCHSHVEEARRELGRVLEAELSPAVEMEFRRNAERYWRNVLDGRSGDDLVYGQQQQRRRGFGGSVGGGRSPSTPSSARMLGSSKSEMAAAAAASQRSGSAAGNSSSSSGGVRKESGTPSGSPAAASPSSIASGLQGSKTGRRTTASLLDKILIGVGVAGAKGNRGSPLQQKNTNNAGGGGKPESK